jgi:hypothetical protein
MLWRKEVMNVAEPELEPEQVQRQLFSGARAGTEFWAGFGFAKAH